MPAANLLVDLSDDLSACYSKLCLLSHALPSHPNFACYPKTCLPSHALPSHPAIPKPACSPTHCLLTQTLPAIPSFACYPKLCPLSQTLPAIPNFACYPHLRLLPQALSLKVGSLTRRSDVWQHWPLLKTCGSAAFWPICEAAKCVHPCDTYLHGQVPQALCLEPSPFASVALCVNTG